MTVSDRNECMEMLSEKLEEKQLRKVITQGYSDISLSLMASSTSSSAKCIANSLYSVSTVNKLTEALNTDKIDTNDFWRIMEYAEYGKANEKYIDDFLKSIDNGIYHTCAANLFTAMQYEDISYNKGLEYVLSGAFYPTEYASLTVTGNVAKELDSMGVELRGCAGFNHYYYVDDIQASLDDGDAIFVKDRDLAVKVNELMRLPDWRSFKDGLMIDNVDVNALTGAKLGELHDSFVRENNAALLYSFMRTEYDDFINRLKERPAEDIISSAYEIVTKQNILSYCENYTPELSQKQYDALFTSDNVLDEVYETWCSNGELHTLYDVGQALEDTADDMQYSIDRAEQAELSKQPEKQTFKKPKGR